MTRMSSLIIYRWEIKRRGKTRNVKKRSPTTRKRRERRRKRKEKKRKREKRRERNPRKIARRLKEINQRKRRDNVTPHLLNPAQTAHHLLLRHPDRDLVIRKRLRERTKAKVRRKLSVMFLLASLSPLQFSLR